MSDQVQGFKSNSARTPARLAILCPKRASRLIGTISTNGEQGCRTSHPRRL